MRKLISILTFILAFQISKGQDSIRRFEFGSTLMTINSFSNRYYFPPDRPSFEFINGLFFRYTKKRLGLRFQLSYTENSASFSGSSRDVRFQPGYINNKDFRLGGGGQFSLLKSKEWLYTFLDLTYRNVFSTGHYFSVGVEAEESYSRTVNGFDCFLGLGFKIKALKHVYLSPEFSYFWSSNFINQTTNNYYGQPSKFNYSELNLDPVIKLHLTAKF